MPRQARGANGDVRNAAIAPVGVEQHEGRARREIIVHGERQPGLRMRGPHRGDPVREHERLVERYGAVEENLRDRRLLENRLETQERGNPVDVLAAGRPEYLQPIIERRQIVRAQEHGDPARQALANQLLTILIRAAAQVVIEHHAKGRAAGEPRQHASHGVDVIERWRPEVLRARSPHDPAQVAVPQPSPGRAREPDELAEFPVALLARFHRVRDVELEALAVVEAQFEHQLARRVPRRISRDHEARGSRVAQQRKGALHVRAHEPEMRPAAASASLRLRAAARPPRSHAPDARPTPNRKCASRWSRAGRFRTAVPELCARSWSHQERGDGPLRAAKRVASIGIGGRARGGSARDMGKG